MRFASIKPSLVSLSFITLAVAAGYAAQRPARNAAAFCTPDGGKGSARCGGTGGAASCLELHPNNDEGTGVCQTEEALPNCCAASPFSSDRTAKECHCCPSKHASLKMQITIPYDPID